MELSCPLSRHDFKIGLICALPLEAGWAQATFDHTWRAEDLKFGKPEDDSITYTFGVIGRYNVVLAHMPYMGKVSACTSAVNMHRSFPNIKLAVVVGICGGVPSDSRGDNNIHLGDVVISKSLVQYDLGRQHTEQYIRKDAIEDRLSPLHTSIRGLVTKLESFDTQSKVQNNMMTCFKTVKAKYPKARSPGPEADKLFCSSYVHKHGKSSSAVQCDCQGPGDWVCETALQLSCKKLGCSEKQLVSRTRLGSAGQPTAQWEPRIHVGRMGSGDTVIKSGKHRDSWAKQDGIIAFEMEGAGVWEQFPTIVVKGVCDYADSHKNKDWQNHAAAMAACCVKAILQVTEPEEWPKHRGMSFGR